MSDSSGIGKGVAEGLAGLGKQVVTEVAKTPAKLVGFDSGTSESTGQGTGGKQQGQQQTPQMKQASEQIDPLAALKQQEDVETQKKLSQARRLLQLLMQPNQPEQTLQEKLQLEEAEKQRKEVEEEKEKAKMQLMQSSAKRPRGDLYGVKAKKFGGEVGKNVVSQ